MIAIHQAWQDGTPLVLFVGLVPLGHRQRESFQDFDIRGWFGTTTKRVLVLDEPGRAGEIVAEAFFTARSGRPGPVVVGLPEDVLRGPGPGDAVHPLPVSDGAVDPGRAGRARPAARRRPPAARDDRRQRVEPAPARPRSPPGSNGPASRPSPSGAPTGWCPATRRSFAGTLGYRRDDTAAAALDEADLLLAIGCVLGEIDTDGYRLRQRPDARTVIVSIDPARTGHVGPVTSHILARPDVFAAALSDPGRPGPSGMDGLARGVARGPGALRGPRRRDRASRGPPASMTGVLRELVPQLPRDAMLTYGAGNHTGWAQRFVPTLVYPALLSTRNGSMGYSIPPPWPRACATRNGSSSRVTGDGDFMMNGNELATARQHGANPLVILMDNGQFGTIRAHQEGSYPGRVSGTQLVNPDFAAIGEAMGAYGARVERADQVAPAVKGALRAVREERRPALLHVVVDPAVLRPDPPT